MNKDISVTLFIIFDNEEGLNKVNVFRNVNFSLNRSSEGSDC